MPHGALSGRHWPPPEFGRGAKSSRSFQLGAILAIVWLYRDTFGGGRGLAAGPSARRLLANLVIASAGRAGRLPRTAGYDAPLQPPRLHSPWSWGNRHAVVGDRRGGPASRVEYSRPGRPRHRARAGVGAISRSRVGAPIMGGLAGLSRRRPGFRSFPLTARHAGPGFDTSRIFRSFPARPALFSWGGASFVSALVVRRSCVRLASHLQRIRLVQDRGGRVLLACAVGCDGLTRSPAG